MQDAAHPTRGAGRQPPAATAGGGGAGGGAAPGPLPGRGRAPAAEPDPDAGPARGAHRQGRAPPTAQGADDVRDEIMRLGGSKGPRYYDQLTKAADAFARDRERDALRMLRARPRRAARRAERARAVRARALPPRPLPGGGEGARGLRRAHRLGRPAPGPDGLLPRPAPLAEGRRAAGQELAAVSPIAGARHRGPHRRRRRARRPRPPRRRHRAARAPRKPVAKPREHHLRLWYALADLEERAGNLARARAAVPAGPRRGRRLRRRRRTACRPRGSCHTPSGTVDPADRFPAAARPSATGRTSMSTRSSPHLQRRRGGAGASTSLSSAGASRRRPRCGRSSGQPPRRARRSGRPDGQATSVPVTVWDPPALARDPRRRRRRRRRRARCGGASSAPPPAPVGAKTEVEADVVARARDRRRLAAVRAPHRRRARRRSTMSNDGADGVAAARPGVAPGSDL